MFDIKIKLLFYFNIKVLIVSITLFVCNFTNAVYPDLITKELTKLTLQMVFFRISD